MIKYAKYIGSKADYSTVREVVVDRRCARLKTFYGHVPSFDNRTICWHESGAGNWFWGQVHHTREECERMV